MARNLAVAAAFAALAPLLCMSAIYFSDTSLAPSLLSTQRASSSSAEVPAVPVPQPLTLQPAVSMERALNVLPLWHGRLDEDVMANPPPPFYSHAPFARKSSTLRSAAEFASNRQTASIVAGSQDSYQSMKAQYKAQEEKMRRVTKAATYNIRPASLDAPAAAPAAAASSHRTPPARQQSVRTFPRVVSRFSTQGSRDSRQYGYSHAGFIRDTSFYQAANSKIGIAKFDAGLASAIQQRRPHLAQDLEHISAAVVGSIHPRARAPPAAASTAAAALHHAAPPLASLTPLLPASLRRKLMPHDTTFYQAANSRDGIANFDAHLATEIQSRRPNLAHDLKRISASILSPSLSSLRPLLPPPVPKSSLTSANHLDSLTPLLPNSDSKVAQAPSIAFERDQRPNDVNYARIYQEHSAPTSHFPQQEEAWIKFAASGASFGGNTKEQREAVKKVWLMVARAACVAAFLSS